MHNLLSILKKFKYKINIFNFKVLGHFSIILINNLENHSKYMEIKNIFDNYCYKIELVNNFINLFVIDKILEELQENFVFSIREKKKIFIEYGSINPTGFKHLGNDRNLHFGKVLSNLFNYFNYEVVEEYLINNSGGQIQELFNNTDYYLTTKKLLPNDLKKEDEIINFIINQTKKQLIKEKYTNFNFVKESDLIEKYFNKISKLNFILEEKYDNLIRKYIDFFNVKKYLQKKDLSPTYICVDLCYWLYKKDNYYNYDYFFTLLGHEQKDHSKYFYEIFKHLNFPINTKNILIIYSLITIDHKILSKRNNINPVWEDFTNDFTIMRLFLLSYKISTVIDINKKKFDLFQNKYLQNKYLFNSKESNIVFLLGLIFIDNFSLSILEKPENLNFLISILIQIKIQTFKTFSYINLLFNDFFDKIIY